MLIKYNSSGDTLWTQVGYSAYENMNGADSEGGILFTGSYYNDIWLRRTTAGGGVY